MTDESLKQYTLIESSKIKEGTLSIWSSPGNSDTAWDEFLMKTPLGQFQQSSMWAQVKAIDGWECLRVVATIDEQIAGGFQILWKRTRLGRIGYVSKGSVAAPETQDLIERLVVLMRDQARKHNIRALIVQPPDDSRLTSEVLERHRFIQSNPMGVIETTLLLDTSKGEDNLEKGISRNTRSNVRKAGLSGVTIREGTEKDIGLFFSLMSATCKRHGEKPNPASEEALGQLWRLFSKNNCLRVTFAEYNEEVLAGGLNILFGEKVNLWKKGWNSRYREQYPNDLLYYETLHWASVNKFNNCDFAAFDRDIADTLKKGAPLSETQKKTRHIFNLRFGGVPKVLPPARIWFDSPIMRFGYENILMRTGLMSLLKRIH